MGARKNYLVDMDGVLVRGMTLIAGAGDFVERLKSSGSKFLVLTNNPVYTPGDLSRRLHVTGLEIGAAHIFTSALATAMFLETQRSPKTAFVVGESGLLSALQDAGMAITEDNPQYVVLGQPQTYDLEAVTKAVRLVAGGAKFIATNPDASSPAEGGIVPACGAMAALIEAATGRSPFFVGKPNSLMMRTALNYMNAHSEHTVMVGDRMDTDIVAGVEAGMETVLVLTGVTRREDLANWPYQPTQVVESVAEIEIAPL